MLTSPKSKVDLARDRLATLAVALDAENGDYVAQAEAVRVLLALEPCDTTATDCRSEDGETVGLIDAAILTLRLASRRNLGREAVLAALADLRGDSEVAALLAPAPLVSETPSDAQRLDEIEQLVEGHFGRCGEYGQDTSDDEGNILDAIAALRIPDAEQEKRNG